MNSRYQNLCPNCFAAGFDAQCSSCGYTALSAGDNFMLLVPGFILNNRYVVGRALGSGGFGITYLALDTETNERVAIKEYLPTGVAVRDSGTGFIKPGNQDSRGIFEHGIKVFLNEAAVLQRFAGQTAIVQVKDCFEANGTAYFSMEFLDGVNLKALARSSNKKLPYKLAFEVLTQVAKALDVVHSKGLLHRDVSPENIFITKTGAIKLIDFGATRYFVGERSRSLSVILKPGFAPPEQYSTKGTQGPWTDVYALAATFYTVVSGTSMPDSLDRLNGRPLPKLSEIAPEVSHSMSNAIDKALKLKSQERCQSMGDFLALLQGGGKNPAKNPVKKPVQHVPVPAVVIQSTPYVVFQSKTGSNKWIVPKNIEMLIGRSLERCNIVINSVNVSRVHCTLRYDDKAQCFYLKDLSTNGTFLGDGKRLVKNEPYTLKLGGTFYLLSTEYLLKVGVE
jgi:serine/threonine protein kinase